MASPAMGRGQIVLYRAIRALVEALCRLFFAVTVDGKEHIPADGAFVLAPVHRSNLDFALVACTSKRRIRFMGKESLWKVPVLRELIETLGAYRVNRGTADREALRVTEELLRSGEPVVMFPEGTRKEGPIVEHVFEGVAFVASRNGVPIVPVGIGGSARAMPKGAKMFRPVRVHLIVGKPLLPDWDPAQGRPPRRVVHALTERVQRELQALYDEAEARVASRRS
jgi:1-acyl-sn-glycerol-3-phosphate acyltransferase